jgi:hypothetical protein
MRSTSLAAGCAAAEVFPLTLSGCAGRAIAAAVKANPATGLRIRRVTGQ